MINRAIEGLPTLSASKINTYRHCAKQYELQYLKKANERGSEHMNIAALLGSALHRAVELYYKEGKSPTGVFQAYMTDTLTRWEDEHQIINMQEYFPRAMKVGKDILTAMEWDQFNPIALEHKFILPFPNKDTALCNISGIIDLIDISGIVVDFKSASVAPIQDELDNAPQFLLYYWAYTQLYDAAPWKTIWYHLRTHKRYEANIQHQYTMKLEKLQEDIQAIIASQYFARKKLSKTCHTECSFYEFCFGTP